MRRNDVLIFGNRAWMVLDSGERVHLRLLAGPLDEDRNATVQPSMLQGRPVYRMISTLDDVDAAGATREATGEMRVEDFGTDPRKWAEAFCSRNGAQQCPDQTIMLAGCLRR